MRSSGANEDELIEYVKNQTAHYGPTSNKTNRLSKMSTQKDKDNGSAAVLDATQKT